MEGLPEDGVLEPVAQDAQNVLLHDDRPLAQGEGQGVDRPGGVVGGGRPLGDLHQGHQVRGIPEVHPAEPAGAPDRLGHVGDPKPRGVGGQEGVAGDQGGDLGPEVPLHRQVLGDVLDDETGCLVGGKVRGEGDPSGDGLRGLGQVPPVLCGGQVPGDGLPGPVQGALPAVPEGGGIAALGEQAGEDHAHGARAGHDDVGHNRSPFSGGEFVVLILPQEPPARKRRD